MVESLGKEENEEGDVVIDSERGNVPCPLTTDTKESKSIAMATPGSGAAPNSGNIPDERIYAY